GQAKLFAQKQVPDSRRISEKTTLTLTLSRPTGEGTARPASRSLQRGWIRRPTEHLFQSQVVFCTGSNRHFLGGKWTRRSPNGRPFRRYRGGCADARTTDPKSPFAFRLDPAAVPTPGERRTCRMRPKRTVDFPVAANFRLLRPGPKAHEQCLPPSFSVPGSIGRRRDRRPAAQGGAARIML